MAKHSGYACSDCTSEALEAVALGRPFQVFLEIKSILINETELFLIEFSGTSTSQWIDSCT